MNFDCKRYDELTVEINNFLEKHPESINVMSEENIVALWELKNEQLSLHTLIKDEFRN